MDLICSYIITSYLSPREGIIHVIHRLCQLDTEYKELDRAELQVLHPMNCHTYDIINIHHYYDQSDLILENKLDTKDYIMGINISLNAMIIADTWLS